MENQMEIVARLKRIFECFLQENFATTNAVYFEKLITHLAAAENAYVLQAPFALEWVDKCIDIISEDFKKLNPRVISFMFNFFGLMTLNEWIVIEIRERQLVNRTLNIVKRDSHQLTPSMKLGIIRLLSAVSRNSIGLAYARSTKAWHFLIEYCNQDHTLYVVREARHLLYELLYKFSVKTNNEQIVLEMLNEILKPIHENVFHVGDEKITINVDDTQLQHRLSSTLDLVSYIFQQTLESEEKSNIAQLAMTHHNIELNIWKLTEMTQNPHFLQKIMTALSSFNYAKLVYEKWNGEGEIAPENFNEFGIAFFNMMKFCVVRQDCVNFLKLAELNHILWKKLGKRAPSEIQIENERVRFENQLITFHLLPVHFILHSPAFLEEELFDEYLMKVFEILCEHTLRICYAFRDVLFNSATQTLAADLAYKSIYGILSMEHILERDQAVIVFQAVIYALKEFILSSHSKDSDARNSALHTASRKMVLIVEVPNVLYAILVGLRTLIERYKITWKESIETTCLVNCTLNLLENPDMTARLVVQALKLLQLSIEHFLSPNMALLVDNLQGSGLNCMGPIIVKRFHDSAWEVRDSALELVSSIANISYLKFPAFQKFLLEYKMGPVAYDMAKSDSEPYVRASALKCIAQMVPINMVWEHDLSRLDVIEHLLFVMYNESEGIVRKEAVCTLSTIYEHRKIPSRYKDTLYSTLAYCVVDDLHWEVKVNALHFWRLEVRKQLTNQGMIDGTFPTVTFSKEHKKIVTLTAKEISRRILKVMNDLSQRGYLGVMLKCLKDDCDLGVIKVAVCMLQRMLENLKKYNYESVVEVAAITSNQANSCENHIAESPKPAMTAKQEPVEQKKEFEQEELDRDAIIESILDAQDINLLAAAYEKQIQLNGGWDEKAGTTGSNEHGEDTINERATTQGRTIDPNYYQKFTSVSTKQFVDEIKRIDFDQLLHKQHEWFLCAESFSSLLDDILCTIRPDPDFETISADCY